MGLPDGALTCEDRSGPTLLHFTYQEECCQAFAVRAVSSGFLLCIPNGGIKSECFELAETEGYSGLIGPFTEVSVKVAVNRSKRTLSVILFDLDSLAEECLSIDKPDHIPEDEVKVFGSYRGQADFPSAQALLEIAAVFVQSGEGRLEHYSSAVEELDGADPLDGEPLDPPPLVGGDMGIQQLLQRLLAQNEVTQKALKDKVQAVSRLEARIGKLEAQSARSAPAESPVQAAAAPQLFQLDPQNLGSAQMAHLRSLAGRGPGKLKDLGASGKAPLPRPPLDGITEGDELEDGAEPDLGQMSTLEKLLTSQTALMEKLVKSKTNQNDPLSLLGGNIDSTDSEDMPKSTGVRGIAARQLLTDSFRRHPAKVVQIFKERLALARRKGDVSELEPRDLWYHFQDQVPLGSHRTLTHMSFIAAAMYEAMERGQLERLKMLVVMQAVFTEQACYDGGGLRMAHLLTGLEDPPFSQTE